MKPEFRGEPVAGGTYPAAIWKTFMQALLKIDPLPKSDGGDGTGKSLETPTPGAGGGGDTAVPSGAPPGGWAAAARRDRRAAGAAADGRADGRRPDAGG